MGFDDAFPVSLIEPRFKNLTDFAFKKPECLDTLFIQTLKKNQPCNILGGSIYIYNNLPIFRSYFLLGFVAGLKQGSKNSSLAKASATSERNTERKFLLKREQVRKELEVETSQKLPANLC